ncbi:hypothetical protein CNR22_07775 [Sphingobacteriaceae bacterium]|nr:hypothetical protein CNR22_07775 [Sphingobacteriaceae bacterium]
MIKRIILILTIILVPFCASADALDGLALIYNLYAMAGVLAGVFGSAVLIMDPKRKELRIATAIVCLLVGYPCLDMIARWGLEIEFIGPLFCFVVGVISFIRVLFRSRKQSGSE